VEETHHAARHVVGHDHPEVEEHEVTDGLDECHHGQGFGLAFELTALVVGEVWHWFPACCEAAISCLVQLSAARG